MFIFVIFIFIFILRKFSRPYTCYKAKIPYKVNIWSLCGGDKDPRVMDLEYFNCVPYDVGDEHLANKYILQLDIVIFVYCITLYTYCIMKT